MKKLIERILNDDDIDCEKEISRIPTIIYNRRLKDEGFPQIPESWLELLKIINGIWYDGAEIYGLEPESTLFQDLLQKNKDNEQNEGLLLGENDMEYLIFDGNDYLIVDREDGKLWHKTPHAAMAAGYLLKL